MSYIDLDIKWDEEEAEAAEVYVKGKLNNHDYQFLLDTGSGRTIIVSDETNSAFETVNTHESSGVFEKVRNDLIMIPKIEIGPIVKTNFVIARTLSQSTGRRHLIGMDILKDYRCHFMFNENRVYIDSASNLDPTPITHDLIVDKTHHPYIDVHFGSTSASTVWDTGASLTVVDANFIQNHPNLFESAGESTGIDATGASVQTPMFVMSEAIIGGHNFSKCRVAGVDLSHVNASIEMPMDMILGYNILSQVNWLFDFPQKKWGILPKQTTIQ